VARTVAVWGAILGVLALLALVVAGAVTVWPRVSAERHRALEAARTMADGAVPAAALDRASVEVRPVPTSWMVIFHGASVPCQETALCRGNPRLPQSVVYEDVFVCVEYGTGRAYMVGGMVRTVGLRQSHLCQASPFPSRSPTP
jgi:hypothetical protein